VGTVKKIVIIAVLLIVATANSTELRKVFVTDSTTGDTADVNTDNQLHVVMAGKIDTANSSTTPLGIDGVFTGTAVNTLEFSVIQIIVFSNIISATDGFSIEFSPDGTNWDSFDKYTIPAGTGKTFSFQPSGCYYRIVYTNSGVGQTTFRLQSVLKKTYIKPSSHRVMDNIIGDDDAELVKAVITGKNPGGTFVNFQATTAGNFKVSLEELESDISSNANAQLNITQFDSSGNELFDTSATKGFVSITDGTDDADIVTHEGDSSLKVSLGHRESFFIHLDAENIAATAGFMLIDLSDSTNWPHTNTHHIVLDKIIVATNPSTAFAGDIDFGFLTDVDADNGDFNIIGTVHLAQQAESSTNNFDFDVYGLDLELAEWFGPTVADDATWQTDVNLQGPDGVVSFPSGAGDFVLKITRTGGNVDVGVTVVYTTRSE